jgi:urease accessory protein
VRLIPLGQTDGPRVIAALAPWIAAAAEAALMRPPEDLGSAAPMVDLLSMRHEVQYTRLFRS